MSLSAALPELEVYYDPPAKSYLIRDDRSEFVSVSPNDLKRQLKGHGFSPHVAPDALLSDIDIMINKTQTQKNVDYAGPLAGHKAGIFDFEGRRVLVTNSPRFIEAKEGPWPTLKALFHNMLGEKQELFFYCWLKIGIAALREGRTRPGQILVIAGPAGCGKSLVQNLITDLLGGRSAKPYQYFCGLTQFNSELFHAEHLMVEDEAASPDIRIRRTFGRQLNGCVVNETHRCHPKNRQAIMLPPWWRPTITLNDEPENLMVLPPMDESLLPKFMIFRAVKADMPLPTETTEQRKVFRKLLMDEMPGFLYHLLNEQQIPADMKCNRFGVTHYHNEELMQMMSALSPEMKLMEIIDAELWKDSAAPSGLEMKSTELESKLAGPGSAMAHEARKLFYYNTACGQYLARLERLYPDRVSQRTKHGYTYWTIEPPPDRPPINSPQ